MTRHRLNSSEPAQPPPAPAVRIGKVRVNRSAQANGRRGAAAKRAKALDLAYSGANVPATW